MARPTETLLELALAAGFDLAACGPPELREEDRERFRQWIAKGRQASMTWLARNEARILDPTLFFPEGRGLLTVALDYSRSPASFPGGGRLARYAAGRDYHRVFRSRLRKLRTRLAQEFRREIPAKIAVDAAPVLERALALRTGLGFSAKSCGLIHPRRGPWLLLGEVFLDLEVEAPSLSNGSCGTCTACLEACPTGALIAPFRLDARLCLSYTTIEHRGPIPRDLREAQGAWVFGCDLCLEVCPYTSRAAGGRADEDSDLRPHLVTETYDLEALIRLSEREWEEDWTGTALRRAGRMGLRRNAALVAGNLRREDLAPALRAALEEADSGLRTAAAWALGRLGSHREALDRALAREEDPATAADLRASLEGAP